MLSISPSVISNRTSGQMRMFHVLLLCCAQAATVLPQNINAEDLRLQPFACPDGRCQNNTFCSSSLGATGLTLTASQAVEAMCALQGPGYFSESAADFFMAARFRNRSGDNSTEPHTPWMLADYTLNLKRIDGFAQVDLLLCNNASCSIVADLQRIRPFHNNTAVLAMGFSGVSGLLSAAGVAMGSIGKEHLDTPPDLVPASGAWANRLDGDAQVAEVQWRVPNANLLNRGPNLVELREFAQESYNSDKRTWRWLAVGHYNATMLSYSQPVDGVLRSGNWHGRACVTVLWPRHPWMIERGWKNSDRACEEQYKAALADPEQELPRVYLFDSYVNAAHVFFNPRAAAAVKPKGVVEMGAGEALNISFFTGSAADLQGQVAPLKKEIQNFRRRKVPRVQRRYPRFSDAFHEFGGRYGLTYSSSPTAKDLRPEKTQEDDGCIVACTNNDNNCLACDVLSIGTAAIAARRVDAMLSSNAMFSAAIHKLRRYAQIPDSSRDFSSYSDIFPWCLVDGLNPGLFDSEHVVHVVVQASASADMAEEQTSAAVDGGILFNCSLLGGLGLGYADRTWDAAGRIVPKCSDDACVPATALAGSQLWFVLSSGAYWDFLSPKVKTFTKSDEILTPMDGAGWTSVAAIEEGMQRVLQHAASVLQQRAAAELSTTDTTRRWPGALLDLSVTVVAIVAMASGLRDIHGWLHGKLVWALGRWAHSRFLWTWVCKPLTALIVLLGLLMAPVFIVVSDSNSHTLNANGTSSTVGWLAADTSAAADFSEYSDYSFDVVGVYMLVAAVAIRLKSVRDEVAFRLEIFNTCVAGIASLCILFSLVWRVPFSDHQELPTNPANEQQAAATPRGGSDMFVAMAPLPRSFQVEARRN